MRTKDEIARYIGARVKRVRYMSPIQKSESNIVVTLIKKKHLLTTLTLTLNRLQQHIPQPPLHGGLW